MKKSSVKIRIERPVMKLIVELADLANIPRSEMRKIYTSSYIDNKKHLIESMKEQIASLRKARKSK